jgi:hypothetical protein
MMQDYAAARRSIGPCTLDKAKHGYVIKCKGLTVGGDDSAAYYFDSKGGCEDTVRLMRLRGEE